MYRYTTILINLILIQICFGQNIPNGNFEKWNKRNHYKATGWYAYNNTVYRTTAAHVGKYAIVLQNKYSETGNGSRGYATNYRSDDKSNFGGFAFEGEPFSLVFSSKHDLAQGDTARIYVDFRDNGSYKGRVDFRFSGSTNGRYVTYRVPISWSGARLCDSVRITLYSKVLSKIQGDGYVIYDDIHFENIGFRSPEIYNTSFDEWYDFGLDFPTNWNSIDLRNYDYSRNFYTRRSVEFQDTEAFLGNSSLAIRNYISGNRARVGYCYIGPDRDHYYTPAFAMKDTFKYFQGYYKYLPEREDTALLNFRTYTNQTRRSNNYLELPAAEDWTFFSMPLTYNNQYSPDSASFIAYASLYKDTVGDETVLYLDNLDLTMEPTPINLSVAKTGLNDITIFPNPVTNVLKIDSDFKYHYILITDLSGRTERINTSDNIVDFGRFNPGLYFLSLHSKDSKSRTIKLFKI